MANKRMNIKVSTSGTKKAKSELSGVSGGLKSLGKQAMMAGGAFFAVGGIINGLKTSIELSAKFEGVSRGFNNLSKSAGFTSQAFDKFRKATDGTMSSMDLMQQANNAMLLGITDSEDQMAEMFDVAQRLASALGKDTAFGIESLVTGLGRQSKLMLDNLGIMVDVASANENYAVALGKSVSELTDAEKKQAFVNETMDSAKELVKSLGEEQLTTNDSILQMNTAWEDAQIRIGEALSVAVIPMADAMKTISEAMTGERVKAYALVITGTLIVALTMYIRKLKLAILWQTKTGWGAMATAVGVLAGELLVLSGVFDETSDTIDDTSVSTGNLADEQDELETSIKGVNKELLEQEEISKLLSDALSKRLDDLGSIIGSLQLEEAALKNVSESMLQQMRLGGVIGEQELKSINRIVELKNSIKALTEAKKFQKQLESESFDTFEQDQLAKLALMRRESKHLKEFIKLYPEEAVKLGLVTQQQLDFFESLGEHSDDSKEKLINFFETGSEAWADWFSARAEEAGFESPYAALGLPEPEEIGLAFEQIVAIESEFNDRRLEQTKGSYALQAQELSDSVNRFRAAGIEEIEIAKFVDEAKRNMDIVAAQQFASTLATSLKAMTDAGIISGKSAKRAAQLQAMVDALAGANAAFKAMAGIPIVGPALGFIAATAAFTAGLANVRMIEKQKFAQGGIVPGQGNQDTVPAMLTPGEVILNQAQQANLAGGMGITINIQGNMVGNESFVRDTIIPELSKARKMNLA